MSDTPRTDLVGGYGAMLEHAHQLERELTDAQAEIEHYKSLDMRFSRREPAALRSQLDKLRAECEGLRVKVSEYEKALRWIDKYGGCSHPANFVSVARAALRKFDAAMNEGRSDE